MSCCLIIDIREQIIDINVNDSCTGTWNYKSISYKTCSPDCTASRVGNKNFTPAVTPHEGVNQSLCDPV